MTLPSDRLERLAVDTIRTLSIDGVQQANSGHPGAPMGAAAMAFALWTRHLRHAPTHPEWPDRDRFVLSAGHASMLLYSLLHLTGYGVSLDDLRSFRQWGSITPGHPEFGLTPGVEATTGPLGQGLSNGVGMAIAERRLAAEFNRPGHDVIDHRTYVICSDGDLQEGISAEACSLAGHLRLGKLIALYDDNRIQLDGPTALAFSEDVLARFAAYGWHTQRVEDGNDVAAVSAAIEAAQADPRPSIIAVRTHIGFGSPNKQDTQKAHGAPLGADEVRLTKEAYGWDPDRTFYVPDEAAELFRRAVSDGEARVAAWDAKLAAYGAAHPGRGRRAPAPARRPPAGRLGRDAAVVGDGLRGRHPQRQPGRDPGAGRHAARAVRRLGRPVGVEPHRRQGKRPRPLRGRQPRAQPPVRRPRARDGRDRQRHRAPRRVPAVRRHLPHVQRLHARQRPARRPVRPPRDLRLDARLDRAGRGRSDAPAGGALRGAARHPEPVVRPAGRRQRGGRGLGARGGAAVDPGREAGPGRAGVHPPEAAHAPRHEGARTRRRPSRRVRPARGGGRRAGADPRRHGLGALAVRGCGRRARGGRDPDPRREPALLGALRRPGGRVPRVGAAGSRPPARDGRVGRVARLGALRGRRGRDPGPRPVRGERPGRHDREGASGSPPTTSPPSGGGSCARGCADASAPMGRSRASTRTFATRREPRCASRSPPTMPGPRSRTS